VPPAPGLFLLRLTAPGRKLDKASGAEQLIEEWLLWRTRLFKLLPYGKVRADPSWQIAESNTRREGAGASVFDHQP